MIFLRCARRCAPRASRTDPASCQASRRGRPGQGPCCDRTLLPHSGRVTGPNKQRHEAAWKRANRRRRQESSVTVKSMQGAQRLSSQTFRHQETKTATWTDLSPDRGRSCGNLQPYIVHKWIELTGGFRTKPQAASKDIKLALSRKRRTL